MMEVYYESIKREPKIVVYYESMKRKLIENKDKRNVSFCVSISIYREVYYESRKRELKRRLINEGRCDERLKAKVEGSTCLTYTGLNDKTN